MLINFKVNSDIVGIIEYHLWINEVQFYTNTPIVWLGILGTKDILVSDNFYDDSLELCLIKIKKHLDTFFYKPYDVELSDRTQMTDEIAGYLINFAN